MILGIGTDLLDSKRIDDSIQRFGDRFVNKILSPKERNLYKNDIDINRRISKVFATKEALVKALGTGFRYGISWQDISLLKNDINAPYIEIKKNSKTQEVLNKLSKGKETDIKVSISDEKNDVLAFVIIQTI